MKESVQLFLVVASALSTLLIFIGGLVTYNYLSSEGEEESKDVTAVRSDFKTQQAPSVIEEPGFIVPEKYPRLKDAEEEPIERILKSLKKKGPTANLLKELKQHQSMDIWHRLPDSFLLSDSWLSDQSWAPMIALADEVKHEDLFCKDIEKLEKLLPYLLDSRRCPITPQSPTANDAFRTMIWALRAQQLLTRLVNETVVETTNFETIESLAESLKSCAVKWERATLNLSGSDEHLETAKYVLKWITTPLTQKLYSMAVRPVEMLYHNRYEDKIVSPSVRKGEILEENGKLKALFSYWDEPRRVALSFLKKCDVDDADAPASCYCYEGPVFYRKAMSLILSLHEKISVERKKKKGKILKDATFSWWEQHLLMTLPYEVVGPWAEDYFIASSSMLKATEALMWCHWSKKVDNCRIYDLVSRNRVMYTTYEYEDIPQRPVTFPFDAKSSEGLTQITDFGSEDQICNTRRLVSKEKFEEAKELFKGSKMTITKKAGKNAPNFQIDPKLLQSIPKEFFEDVLNCFEHSVTSPAGFHLENLRVSYAGEAASDKKGLFREFINNVLVSLVTEETFAAFTIKNDSIEIKGTINPNIMRLLAHIYGKTLQNDSRPSLYFSKELNSLMGSEYPPTKERCLEYARKNFEILKTKSGKKKKPKPWEPSMIRLKVSPDQKRTMIAVDISERIFECGKTEKVDKKNITMHNQRIEIFAEWYVKKCRQTFADTFYKYLTVGGRSYYRAKWLDSVLRPLPKDIGSLANAFGISDDCKGMPPLKDKDGNEYTFEEAFVKAIITINMYNETLYWIHNSTSAPPIGFEKGVFTVRCDRKRGTNNTPLLPFVSTCGKHAEMHLYMTLEEMTNAIRTAILNAPSSLYEEPEGLVRYADDPSKAFTNEGLIKKSKKDYYNHRIVGSRLF